MNTQRQSQASLWLSRLLMVFLMVFTLLWIGAGSAGCAREAQSAEGTSKPQLLIYCGITMTKPMDDIKAIIEKQENCEIVLTPGGSGNLLRAIEHNQVGDLFLPGSDSYIKTALEKGYVTNTQLVGYNKAAMMVQKGNPRNITPDLSNLSRSDYYVVIGNPDSGSIGRETQKILKKAGLFNQVEKNAREFTTDSKRLIQVLRDKQADVVINWFATSTWDGNRQYVDVIPIETKYAKPKKLVLGLLKTSKHPEIARKFMEYAASEKGKAIFNKYGLYNVK